MRRETKFSGRAQCAPLFEMMLGDQHRLAERIREGIRARIPTYRSIAPEMLAVEVGMQTRRALLMARRPHAEVSPDELAELTAIGEARACQGIPVEDLLRAWRVSVEMIVSHTREIVDHFTIDDVDVLEFVQSILMWSDAATAAAAKAHRRAELAQAIADDGRRTTFVRGVLLGTVSAADLCLHTEVYGLDPAAEYVAVRGRLGGVPPQQLERALGFTAGHLNGHGLCAVIDGDVAGFLRQPPPRTIDAVVGFGPPRSLKCLAESYRLAARALTTIQACNLRGAHDLGSLGLRATVAMDTDVGELLRRRYLEPLAPGGSAGELTATLRAYLACGMHVERTAKRLFVHQNTVRYRLSRFEELTGTSLHDTEVLLELWWALELSAMKL